MRIAQYPRKIIAAAAFVLSIQIAPTLAATRDLRACLDHDDKERALAACAKIVDPNSGASKSDRIRAYASRAEMRAGSDDAAAAADYQAAVQLDPKNIGLVQKLGDAYAQASDYPRALETYTIILRLRPGNTDALLAQADAYLKTTPSDPDSALVVYALILRLHPRNENAMVGRGLALAASGDFDSALKQFDQALAINPNSFGRLYRTSTARAQDEFNKCNQIRGFDQQISTAIVLEDLSFCSKFLDDGFGSAAQRGRAIIRRASLYRVWRDLNPP
jgi:tetratricopeptide (TPR) repeat protein